MKIWSVFVMVNDKIVSQELDVPDVFFDRWEYARQWAKNISLPHEPICEVFCPSHGQDGSYEYEHVSASGVVYQLSVKFVEVAVPLALKRKGSGVLSYG